MLTPLRRSQTGFYSQTNTKSLQGLKRKCLEQEAQGFCIDNLVSGHPCAVRSSIPQASWHARPPIDWTCTCSVREVGFSVLYYTLYCMYTHPCISIMDRCYLFIYLSINLSINLSIKLSIYLSIYSFIYLHTHTYVYTHLHPTKRGSTPPEALARSQPWWSASLR